MRGYQELKKEYLTLGAFKVAYKAGLIDRYNPDAAKLRDELRLLNDPDLRVLKMDGAFYEVWYSAKQGLPSFMTVGS